VKLSVVERAGAHALVGALCCVLLTLLLAACQVYDRSATRTRVSNVQTSQDAAAVDCHSDAACSGDSCLEVCNGRDDDCDGQVDESAADSCMLDNAQAVCRDGACQIVRCADDHRDCDQDPENGCEVAPDAVEHCGQCQRACSVEHGSVRCVAGGCELDTCDSGYADCDGDGRSCEIELASDAAHCGECQRSCGFFVESPHAAGVCRKGSCRAECADGFGDCDGKLENGCERSLSTDVDCGECGVACTLANAEAQCVDGVCEQRSCATGYADCDADNQDCEQSLSDTTSCGACDQRCEFAHAQARCNTAEAGYSCELERCDDGWESCDGVNDNGCERDTRSVAAGGDGPCRPDPGCQVERLGDRQLFFCDMQLSWQAARAICKNQRGGDLAELRDAETRILMLSRVNQRVWIGHNSLVEDRVWTWASTNVPFWQGTNNGRAQNGAYTRWARYEPNGSGRCGALSANAEMDDLDCASQEAFICELGPDRCPEDPDKFHPGQCGCGIADTDANENGFAECPD
jgi:hypothetical protein